MSEYKGKKTFPQDESTNQNFINTWIKLRNKMKIKGIITWLYDAQRDKEKNYTFMGEKKHKKLWNKKSRNENRHLKNRNPGYKL